MNITYDLGNIWFKEGDTTVVSINGYVVKVPSKNVYLYTYTSVDLSLGQRFTSGQNTLNK